MSQFKPNKQTTEASKKVTWASYKPRNISSQSICISMKNTVASFLKASKTRGGVAISLETAYLPVAFWLATRSEYMYTKYTICIHLYIKILAIQIQILEKQPAHI